MKRLALLAALLGCSPAYYAKTKSCPTTTMLLGDFVIAVAAGAIAGLHWSSERHVRASAEGLIAAGVWGAANYSETACRK